MPKQQTTTKLAKFTFKGFVNLDFTPTQKDALESRLISESWDGGDCIQVLLEEGYKLGFAYDDYHGTNQVSLTCKDLGSPYAGYCFTFKHNDPIRAILICRWFYDSFLKNEEYRVESNGNKFDW